MAKIANPVQHFPIAHRRTKGPEDWNKRDLRLQHAKRAGAQMPRVSWWIACAAPDAREQFIAEAHARDRQRQLEARVAAFLNHAPEHQQ